MLQKQHSHQFVCPTETHANPDLNQLQWQVIMIAIGEAGRVRKPSIFRNLICSLFGLQDSWRAHKPLANESLEALRRFVWLSRHNDRAACELIPQLLADGLSQTDLWAIGHIAQRP